MKINLIFLILLFTCNLSIAQLGSGDPNNAEPQQEEFPTQPVNPTEPIGLGSSDDFFNPQEQDFLNPEDGPVDPTDPPPFDPGVIDFVPVDGGLSLLLAAGLGLGAKRALGRRKRNAKQDEPEQDEPEQV